jgi:phosphoribosylamine--glycine ligase
MEKKNFLFVSLSGLISDIAWQVSKEGHEVRYFIGDKKEKDIADGFVAKSKDWEKDAEWADILIFDDTLGQGEKAHAASRPRQKSDRWFRVFRSAGR